jgi:thiol:disulfide interchange protein
VKKENQMRVDFTITRKLNDLIKEIPSVSGIMVGIHALWCFSCRGFVAVCADDF